MDTCYHMSNLLFVNGLHVKHYHIGVKFYAQIFMGFLFFTGELQEVLRILLFFFFFWFRNEI